MSIAEENVLAEQMSDPENTSPATPATPTEPAKCSTAFTISDSSMPTAVSDTSMLTTTTTDQCEETEVKVEKDATVTTSSKQYLPTDLLKKETVVPDETIKKEETYNEKPKFPLISSPLKRTVDSSLNLSPTMSKKSSDDADDDDDEEDDEKMLSNSGARIDPEKLKAFNMFCRLFVDENLDRLVPISKQPKDKVQKILDACDRQFPEFHERSRKRIRTYLKSCRRMRRTREINGHSREASRPTPPHLTSPVAEHLLAVACDNETKNFRLINMGLEPSNTPSRAKPTSNHVATNSLAPTVTGMVTMPSLVPASMGQATQSAAAHAMFPEWRFPHTSFRHDLAPFFTNGFFRPAFPGFHGPLPAAALQASQAAANHLTLQHTPTMNDASTQKKQTAATPLSMTASPIKGTALLPSEMSVKRQQIIAFRETATYLHRKADELEKKLSSHTK